MIRTQQNNHRCFTEKPPIGTGIDWGHPLSQGLVAAYLFNEGGGSKAFDLCGKRNGAVNGIAKILSHGYVSGGLTNSTEKVVLNTSSPSLGPLSKSTVFTVFRTTATLGSGSGQIWSGGKALYSERAGSGNDIYKIALANVDGIGALYIEFTYRNDGGTLLQQRVVASGANNGGLHSAAITKNGTEHAVYFDSARSSGTFGSGSTAFTDANINILIGGDIADSASCWNGTIVATFIYNRALSAQEIRQLHENPYQICLAPPAPDQAVIDVPRKYRGGRR